MNNLEKDTAIPRSLDQSSDAELRSLVLEAHAILLRRDQQRKKEAEAKIQEIAKAHGLSVSVKQAGRRGRPRKKAKS
jgi:hypothetical protein